MRHHLTALAGCLAIAIATPASAEESTQFRWMGDMTCGGWRAAPTDFNNVRKAVLLNWVLGIIAGRSTIRGDDLLRDVEISGVAAWLDDYCTRNPLNDLIKGAYDLEQVLIARRSGGRG